MFTSDLTKATNTYLQINSFRLIEKEKDQKQKKKYTFSIPAASLH